MNFNEFLPKELVRKLSGFFMLEENCRGYDPNTPIGEIAEHAFKHWQRHEQEVDKLKRVIRHNADLLELEKEKVADARRIACDFQNVIRDIEEKFRNQKYKRCLDNAWWCRKLINVYALSAYTHRGWKIAGYYNEKAELYRKWHKRWLAIADKFKE